jgi:hypothetical protein
MHIFLCVCICVHVCVCVIIFAPPPTAHPLATGAVTLTADLSTLRATQDRIGALQNEAILFLLAAIEDQRDAAGAASVAAASSSSDASHSGSHSVSGGGSGSVGSGSVGSGGGREGGADAPMIDSWNPVEHGIPSDLNQLHVRLAVKSFSLVTIICISSLRSFVTSGHITCFLTFSFSSLPSAHTCNRPRTRSRPTAFACSSSC